MIHLLDESDTVEIQCHFSVFVVLGVVCYLTRNIFSKNTKEFHITIGQNGIEIHSTFYKK